MINPMPALRSEVAALSAVSAIVSVNPSGTGVRVRNDEPAPNDSSSPFRAFVLLVEMPWNRHPRLPIADLSVVIRNYGRNATEARTLYAAVSAGLHGVGPRVNADGIGFYVSHETEAEFGTDPDTQQPYVEGTFDLKIATVTVTA